MSDYQIPEISNPLTNGRIISVDTPIKVYLDSNGEGGQRILSRSDLCEIYTCPERWHNGFTEPDRRLPSLEFGSLFDCLLLQPKRFEEYYTMAPTEYTNSKKQVVPWTWKSSTCREWREAKEAEGYLVCTEEALAEARKAVNALVLHDEIGAQTAEILLHSDHQVFVIAEYHDKETGLVVPVKCLTDIVPEASDQQFGKCLFDLKSARSAAPKPWRKAVFEDNYHVQAAINLDCHCAAGGDRTDFRHLIVENFAPWQPARRFIDSTFVNLGRMKYLTALRTYCKCITENHWPGYADQTALRLADGYEATSPLPYMVRE